MDLKKTPFTKLFIVVLTVIVLIMIMTILTHKGEKKSPSQEDNRGKPKEKTAPSGKMVCLLSVEEPDGIVRKDGPVVGGLPIPRGMVKDISGLALFSEGALTPRPAQFNPCVRWDDGSLRWVFVNFQTSLEPREKKTFLLKTTSPSPVGKDLLTIDKTVPENIHVETGVLSFNITKEGIGTIRMDLNGDGRIGQNEIIVKKGEMFFTVKGTDKKKYQSKLQSIHVEQNGPIHAIIKISGTHQTEAGETLLSFICRLHVYRNKPWIGLQHTFVNRHGFYALGGDGIRKFRETDAVQISVRIHGKEQWAYAIGGEDKNYRGMIADRIGIVQKTVAPNGEGKYVLVGDRNDSGKRAPGWLNIADIDDVGLTVVVKDFWQLFPKALYGDSTGQVIVDLHPGKYKHFTGSGQTHDILFVFQGTRQKSEAIAAGFQHPLYAFARSEDYCRSRLFGDFLPGKTNSTIQTEAYDKQFHADFEKLLSNTEMNQWGRQEYGMLNYGDIGALDHGTQDVQTCWGNSWYDPAHALCLQFLRTGNRKYLERAYTASKHYANIDVCHCPSGGAPEIGREWPLVWYGTAHKDIWSATKQPHALGRDDASLSYWWAQGIFENYLLLGDYRLYEVGLQMADRAHWFVTSGYSAKDREFDSLGFGRTLHILIMAYQLTQKDEYRHACNMLWTNDFGFDIKTYQDKTGYFTHFQNHRASKDRPIEGQGVLLEALCNYYKFIDHNPEVRKAIIRCAQWIVKARSNKDGTRLAAMVHAENQAPTYFNFFFLYGIGFAYELSGDEKLLEAGKLLFQTGLTSSERPSFWRFGIRYRNAPYFLPYLTGFRRAMSQNEVLAMEKKRKVIREKKTVLISYNFDDGLQEWNGIHTTAITHQNSPGALQLAQKNTHLRADVKQHITVGKDTRISFTFYATGCSRLLINCSIPKYRDNFGYDITVVPQGTWHRVTFRAREILKNRENTGKLPAIGDEIERILLYAFPETATVVVDDFDVSEVEKLE